MRPLLVTVLCLALLGGVASADDAAFEWRSNQNPAFNWSYGWASAPEAAFTPFAAETTFANGVSMWAGPNGASLGLACGDVHMRAATYLGGHVGARAGAGGEATVLRWTAPAAGSFHVSARCLSAQGYLPGLPGPTGINGTQSAAQFGGALAMGDVNGDGYDDVVVGQSQWSNGQSSEGRVLLYLGGPDGWATTPAWSFESNLASALLGVSVAVGDLDGDGYADIVAGAPGWVAATGGACFFRGGATLPAFVTSVQGAVAGKAEGRAAAMADFDGDGHADVVLGSDGSARLFRGNAAFTIGSPIAVAPAIAVDATYGYAMAAAGDVDGDGRGDLLVGDRTLSTASAGGGLNGGRAFLFFGSAIGGTWSTTWSAAGAASDLLGTAVSAAGDVNHDGHDDFLVSSNPPGNGGRVELYLGAAGIPGTSPAWTLDGPSGSGLGSAMVALGDANGDGYGDFVVGSADYANGQVNEGRVQLFLGEPSGIPTAGWSLEPNQVSAFLGSALAAGDLNGDHTRDFVAGAPGYSAAVSNAGRVYLVTNAGPAPRPGAWVDARLVVAGVTVARDTIDTAAARDTVALAAEVALAAGASVDVELADLDPSTPGDMTCVDAVVEPAITPTGPRGPVFALAGQRFVPVRGGPAFEALAFDPVARKFASNGHLYDECGHLLSAGPEGPGIAWDPVTRQFWNIAFNAGTQSWDLASFDTTALTFTTQLSIPRVLNVPGTGPDTLEDARGLALDSSFVYVVDAGPVNLVPPANAWFKFTRAGTPVASLKGAAFAVNAFGDIVDDIVWSPQASPTEPGRLLVAVEHTGIVVLTTTGALADTFTWDAQGVERADRPSAFAGLALDPGSGELFLADNDLGTSEHWVRLADPGVTTYLLSDSDPVQLVRTGAACGPAALWKGLAPRIAACPPSPFIFGLAYRSVDQRAYGVDFGDGTLWKLDPRTGRGVRVGPTFVGSIWGLAWDSQRDRLYGVQQGPVSGQVWSIDPRTAEATPLPGVVGSYPDDIAFEPNGGVLYGRANAGPTPVLVRIDRDSGVGTAVGPTAFVRGLDWDPVRGALVGITASDSLYSINPATGAASPLGVASPGTGWEGLAVVPVAPFATADVPPGPAPARLFLALAAWPRPARDRTRLTFAMPQADDVRLELFDVGGRLVRRLAAGRYAAGAHSLEWNGRLASGQAAASGIYFARLRVGSQAVTSRVVLTR